MSGLGAKKTLVITHDHCALHGTRQISPERPKRLKWVLSALEHLRRDVEKGLKASPLEIREVKTSEPMLAALAEQLLSLANVPSGRPTLLRSVSVGYLEEKILPAVKAVHTQAYISRLASTCVSLMDKTEGAKAELDGDTVVSASSLSAALCAVLSCCYAVDACCDDKLAYQNAFAVIRPPGHHAGANGPTVAPEHFASVSRLAAAK
jgi:acetoin utilization deacetylase AcuC-like enzyme